jgi:hypothetical protein
VVLKADEQLAVDVSREFSNRTTFATTGHDVHETQSFVFVIALDAERRTQNLETSADRHNIGAVSHTRHERRLSQEIGGQALRAVLSPAEQIERGVGHLVVETHANELDVETASSSALRDGEAVAAVAVGSEEIGIEHAERRHGSDLANQSLKAV